MMPDPAQAEQPDIMPTPDLGDSGLVDTPEETPAPVKRRPRKPRVKAAPKDGASSKDDAAKPSQPGAPEAAE